MHAKRLSLLTIVFFRALAIFQFEAFATTDSEKLMVFVLTLTNNNN